MSKNGKFILEQSFISRSGNLHIDLWHPRSNDNVGAIVIGLVDVRAADEIRVSYDYDRDGWKIEQPSVSSWEPGDKVCDPKWVEVGFFKAWAMDKNQ